MIKIAIASTDGINVNQHFGWCQAFYIYQVTKSSFSHIKTIDSSEEKDTEGDKLEYKISCLDNSDIVYVTQIGPKAAGMVQNAGIYPMKSFMDEEPIEKVLMAIQKMMNTPPLWLKRIMVQKVNNE
ncbi:MAG: dinitrogenase iron-molybdenum cofactor biosynthesis protein [Campylobacterales bacterium]|nr:dinitrogenase iron-molybdenum cofactor biosynthesis protein [Campylobacterales bacterium]